MLDSSFRFTTLQRWLVALPLLLLAAYVAYDMHALYQQEELWGYRPLFLLLSVWVAIVFMTDGLFSKQPDRWLLHGAAALSGSLLAFGFPPLPFFVLLFVGWVPLLWVEYRISARQERSRVWSFLPFAFSAMVIWNVGATYWVANTAFVAGVVANFLNALFMCVPLLLYYKTRRVVSVNLGYASLLGYWMTFELLHYNWEISWPWLTLGNGFATVPSLVQWYEYTGVFGGTAWVLTANLFAFYLLRDYAGLTARQRGSRLLTIGGILLVPMVGSYIAYLAYDPDTGREIEVVATQPDFEPHFRKFTMSNTERDRALLGLATPQMTAETDYVLFPETTFSRVDMSDPGSNTTVRRYQGWLADYPDARLLTGVNAHRILDKNEMLTPNVREQSGPNGTTIYYERYNAAIQIAADREKEIPTYRKSKLVPGPEILPYKSWLFFLEPLVDKLGGTMAGLGTQDEPTVMRSGDGYGVAPIICYESVYGAHVARYVRRGAQVLFVVTNDGWWGDTAGYRQHQAYSRLRAIETRRAVVRSANMGRSCFINARGDVLQEGAYGEAVALRGKVSLNANETFYTSYGDLLGRIGLFLAGLLFLNMIVRSRLAAAER